MVLMSFSATFEKLLDRVVFYMTLVAVIPTWIIMSVICDTLGPWSLNDPNTVRVWAPLPQLSPWLDVEGRVPDPGYYVELIRLIYDGDHRHRASNTGPVYNPRVWKHLGRECRRLRQVSPADLKVFYHQLSAELGPLAGHITTPSRLISAPSHRMSVASLLYRCLGTTLIKGSIDAPERWWEISRHWPELWDDVEWLGEVIDTLPSCPSEWPESTGPQKEQEDWQSLWYRCCETRPQWAVPLTDHPSIDPHAEGERGYALLVEYGYGEEAEQLDRLHPGRPDALAAHCTIPAVQEDLKQRRRRRRTKSARSACYEPAS